MSSSAATNFQSPVLGAFFACGEVLVQALRRDAVAERWGEPSALDRMTIGDLCGHTARAVLVVARYLDAAEGREVDDVRKAVDAVGYFLAIMTTDDPDADLNVGIRERSQETARVGAAALADEVAAALVDLRNRVPPVAGVHVEVFGGQVIRLHDYVVTRVLELAVHLDDLAVSIDEPIAIPESAAETAVKTLAEIARRRHGTRAMISQLARRERVTEPVTAL